MNGQIETNLTKDVSAIEEALVACRNACAMYGEGSPEAIKARDALDEVVRKTITRIEEVWLAQADVGTLQ